MHFSSLVASTLALASNAIAAPPSIGHGRSDSLYKAMRSRGRSFIGTAWTIRANETAEPKIIKQDLNS
jgi:endo-1,4-beta-xylanase